MKKSKYRMFFGIGLLAVVGLIGCNQETLAAESGNAATRVAGQAAMDAIQTLMDKARQTEGVLGQSAEQRAAEIKEPRQ